MSAELEQAIATRERHPDACVLAASPAPRAEPPVAEALASWLEYGVASKSDEGGGVYLWLDLPRVGRTRVHLLRDPRPEVEVGDGWTRAQTADLIALAESQSAGDHGAWIHLVRTGRYELRNGEPLVTITAESIAEMVRNFADHPNVYVDRAHDSERAPSGDIPSVGAPAHGWVHELAIGPGGDLLGRVALLPSGSQMVLRRHRDASPYAHLSPAIRLGARHRITGAPIGCKLQSVALMKKMPLIPLPEGT